MKNEHLHSENIRGCKIAWQEAGTGPALVLLHGIGGSSESWHRQIGQLKNNFRVGDVLKNILDIYDRRESKISTSKLNSALRSIVSHYPPPSTKGASPNLDTI